MTDDISMGALSGSIGERSRAAIAAGCDLVLHCNGEMAEMLAVAAEAPHLAGEAARRADAALAMKRPARADRCSPRAAREFADAACPPSGSRRRGPHDRRGLAFRHRTSGAGADEPALVIDVEGFEGPLDLLLTLARQQKVDLAKISILALADQYLAFIEEARKLRLELAADYLVMAAWLAYLKSRLLLPEQHEPDGVSAEDMATALAQRLRRLEAIRQVAEQLLNRPQLGPRSFHARPAGADRGDQAAGMDGDALRSAFGLCRTAAEAGARLCAHSQAHGLVARRSARGARAADRPRHRLVRARSNISSPTWWSLRMQATVRASSFAATLELVREGRLEVHQHAAFAPLYVRKRPDQSSRRDRGGTGECDEGGRT